MQVLIVKSSSLGDIVHALPAARALKRAHPEARIDWLVERDLAPLLAGHPDLSRILTFDSRGPRRQPLSLKPVRRFLNDMVAFRRVRYDAVVDLQRLIKSAVIMGLVRTRRRVGFSAASCREPLASLAYSRKVTINYQNDPVRYQYLAAVQAVSERPLYMPAEPYIEPQPLAEAGAAAKLGDVWEAGFGVALLGVSFPTKSLPFEHWLEILDRVPGDVPVVLPWASQAERDKALSAAAFRRGTVVPPAMSLPQLTALLNKARWVVGGDTGPLHLAAATGTPTVSYYGPTRARRNAPTGHGAVQSPVECSGCVKRRCPKGRPDCLEAVTPDMIWEKLEPLLS
jgi:heptosyltransferase-1